MVNIPPPRSSGRPGGPPHPQCGGEPLRQLGQLLEGSKGGGKPGRVCGAVIGSGLPTRGGFQEGQAGDPGAAPVRQRRRRAGSALTYLPFYSPIAASPLHILRPKSPPAPLSKCASPPSPLSVPPPVQVRFGELFNSFDADRSGTLELEELGQLVAQLVPGVTQAELKYIMVRREGRRRRGRRGG